MTPGEAATVLAEVAGRPPIAYTRLNGLSVELVVWTSERREALALAVEVLTAAQQAQNAK